MFWERTGVAWTDAVMCSARRNKKTAAGHETSERERRRKKTLMSHQNKEFFKRRSIGKENVGMCFREVVTEDISESARS